MLRNNAHADPSPRATMRDTKIRGLFFATLFFSVFTNLLMLTGPLFMLQVYDRVLSSRSEETLVALFGLVAVLYLFYILLEFARGRVMARAGARFQAALNDTVFDAVIDRAAHRQKPAAGTLQDIAAVREMLSGPVMLSIFDLPWTPVFLLAIFIFHPMLGWLAVGGGAVLIVVAAANQILTHKKTLKAAGLSAAASRFAQQAEKGAELIQAQGMGKSMSDRWTQLENAAVEESMRAKDWTGSLTAMSRGFRLFLQSAVLALGAWLVLQNQLTGGAMIAASILLGRALAPVESSLAHWATVQRGRAGWRDLAALLSDETATAVITELPAPDARLSIANLTLLPKPGEKPVLANISFELAPGEAVGVIGRSGSGKTTLARLLVGLAKPTAGEIRLNGSALDRYGSKRLGQYIGYLPQDVVLFDGTVSENIAQMSPMPDSQKVVAAARKAGVHDVITKLPEGYDTRIGMADVHLSGGQKQRLALARALYNDPILLVLDEPNSALDADGSEALNRTVAAMKESGRGVLVMTHRPTAIYACDRLLVLDGGRQAGYGPRDEIIKGMMKNAADVQRVVTRPAQ